jgi:ferric-dicitrate binding protein FerR (iron transport regulator)
MTRNLRPVGLDRLETALDTYGADRTRWPAPLRHELSALIAGDGEARTLLRDAELFDQLLDSAPQYDAARLDSLKQRIENAVVHQPRLVASRPEAAPLTILRRFHGLAATALAASLVLGVMAGQSSIVNSVWNSNSSATGASRQIAQTDDTDVLLDEDML